MLLAHQERACEGQHCRKSIYWWFVTWGKSFCLAMLGDPLTKAIHPYKLLPGGREALDAQPTVSGLWSNSKILSNIESQYVRTDPSIHVYFEFLSASWQTVTLSMLCCLLKGRWLVVSVVISSETTETCSFGQGGGLTKFSLLWFYPSSPTSLLT